MSKQLVNDYVLFVSSLRDAIYVQYVFTYYIKSTLI